MRLGTALTVVALAVAGCGSAPAAPSRAPSTLPDPSTLPELRPVRWSQDIGLPSTFSIAPDASVVAGASVPEAGGASVPWAFTSGGDAIALDGLVGGAVYALSGGTVVIGPGVADPPGPVTVVRPSAPPWTSPQMVGPVFATSNISGTHLAVLDSGNAALSLLRVRADGTVEELHGPSGLGPGATAQFDDQGDLLVADTHQASLLSPAGTAQWSVPIRANALPRSFVLDRDGSGVTAATSGSDNTLYQFAAPGNRPSVAWSEPLASGGANRLVAGPDGRVAIGAVGGSASLAVYRTQDGALQWQDTFSVPAGASKAPSIVAVAFGPHDGVVAALTGCDASGAVCLVLLAGSDGSPLGRVALASGAQTALAANGEAAVTVVAQDGGATLTWLDLSDLWSSPALGASSASSS